MRQYDFVGDGTAMLGTKEIDKKLLFVSINFRNHNVSEQLDTYRYHSINYYDNCSKLCHETHCVSNSFKFPEGMTREDGLKVLSFIIDQIQSIDTLEYNLEKMGFEIINLPIKHKNDNVIELFTVTGKIKRFKISKYYDKYFNWYTKGVTEKDIVKMYDKIGLSFDESNNIKQKVKK